MSLRSVGIGSKGGIILRVVSLQKLCTVVGNEELDANKRGRESCSGGKLGRVEQKWWPDFEYDHSLRPPHAKIARTPVGIYPATPTRGTVS